MHGISVNVRRALAGCLAALFWCSAPLAHAQVAQVAHSLPSSTVLESVDFNQATEAQLDGLRGVGPATTRRILEARGQRAFVDWADLIRRVRGIGPAAAASFSAQGFVVNGARYAPTADSAAALPQGR